MLLIGSRATRYHFPEARKPRDYDFIALPYEAEQFLSQHDHIELPSKYHHKRRAQLNVKGQRISCEFELVGTSSSNQSSSLIYQEDRPTVHVKAYDRALDLSYLVASPETLYLLKRSHITFNIHHDKNMFDFQFLLKRIDPAKFPSWWQQAFALRYNEVKARVAKKQLNFDVSNSEFFRKSEKFVNRIVEHDSLHYATCFGDKPLFLSVKDDVSKAALSERKVMQMSDEMKVQLIQEETQALALERYVIPALIKQQPYNAKHAYRKTAGKMVHNYLPEFLRFFAADHLLEILDLEMDYVAQCLRRHPTLKGLIGIGDFNGDF